MNRLHLSIIVLVTLLLSSCDKRSEPEVLTRLQQWDSEISTRNYFQGDTIYESILDSLKMIDSESLSRKDEALYGLLYTCLSDKTLTDFPNDSIISISVKTFKSENDIRNLFRAMVYRGIVRFRMDASDTVAFTILKEAEQLASSTDDTDESLFRIKGLLYGTMGRILEDDGNSQSVSDYLSKGIDYYKRSGDINNYLIDCLESPQIIHI